MLKFSPVVEIAWIIGFCTWVLGVIINFANLRRVRSLNEKARQTLAELQRIEQETLRREHGIPPPRPGERAEVRMRIGMN